MAVCPHCKKEVTLLSENTNNGVQKEVVGTLKKEVMYACPHCNSVLGFAFFIGGLLLGRP